MYVDIPTYHPDVATGSKHGCDDLEAESSEAPTSKIPQEDWDVAHDRALGTSRSAIYCNKNGLTKKGSDKIGQQGITTFFAKKPLPPLPIAEISCQTQILAVDIDSGIEIIDQPDDDMGPLPLVLDHELFSEYSEMHIEVNVPKTAIPAALHIDEQMSWMDSNLAAEPQSSISPVSVPLEAENPGAVLLSSDPQDSDNEPTEPAAEETTADGVSS
ncbi:hypothetical protein B0H10DRAFT_1940524 [Mycena sp. CBHHK59/15]|nr:hypothetical protein B0H10DRAFT_1940524 [Mycena sp. CBHHK59/15]